MPARVHALLVVRPDGRAPAAFHLTRTLAALAAQTRRADVLTIVLCGGDERLRAVAESSGAEAVIAVGAHTTFASALDIASRRLDGDAVWLLAQDTAPAPDALRRLEVALETAPSVAVAVPKLVEWDDPTRIVSLGRTMTRFGAAVGLADSEHDQGQHDASEDVLGGDVRGLLVHAAAWRELDGLDPALAGGDEGLDVGVRVRLAGGRVVLAPHARIAVAHDGVAGPPAPRSAGTRARRVYAARRAQLHRRLAYAPAAAVPLHWLALLPLALWRTVLDLVGKRPARIGPEWAAAASAIVRLVAVARTRGRIRRHRRASWTQLAPLRVSARTLRQRLVEDAAGSHGPQRSDLGFFSGGGAWTVLAALVVAVASFPGALAAQTLSGGALAPLASSFGRLWDEALAAQRPVGWSTVGPADPFSLVVAILGSFSPADPTRALVVLWILALPLAALGAWFAATRVTERPLLRIVAASAWALAPALLIALAEGRPAAVIVHLALPWLAFTAATAHRSWGSAGTASILCALVVAASPVLAVPVAILWLFGFVTALVRRGRRAAFRWAWLIVPALALSAPLVIARLRSGDALSLLADPGVPAAHPSPAAGDALSRLLLAAGFPADPGWALWSGVGDPTWWAALLTVPLLLLALSAGASARRFVAVALLAVAVLGVATAIGAAEVAVTVAGVEPVPIWSGSALSLAWVGVVGAAVLALDTVVHPRAVRAVAIAAVSVGLVAAAAPALTAHARDAASVTAGVPSTLPAYVAARAQEEADVGTLVLAPTGEGLAVDVVWGASATLGGQSTLTTSRAVLTDADRQVAQIAADLTSETASDVVAELAAHGISFVLLAPAVADEAAPARALRLAIDTALDGRSGLDVVGETDRGALWRVTDGATPRADAPADAVTATRAGWLGISIVFAIALLLALPTRGSRLASRARTRLVGARPATEESR